MRGLENINISQKQIDYISVYFCKIFKCPAHIEKLLIYYKSILEYISFIVKNCNKSPAQIEIPI